MKGDRLDRAAGGPRRRRGARPAARRGAGAHPRRRAVPQRRVSVIDGTIPFPTPVVLGHEGAGVVERGRRRRDASVKVGDHVVLTTLGNCGALRRLRPRPAHPLPRDRSASCGRRSPSAARRRSSSPTPACSPSTTVVKAETQAVVDRPRRAARAPPALIGCGVLTGVGAVFNRAKVQPRPDRRGHRRRRHRPQRHPGRPPLRRACRSSPSTPTRRRRRLARQFGATHFIDAGRRRRHRRGGQGDLPERRRLRRSSASATRPSSASRSTCSTGAARCVLLGVPKLGTEASFVVNTLYNDKSILGCRYGPARPHHDIPLFVELYKAGRLKLDELVSRPTRSTTSSRRSTTCTTASSPAACSRCPDPEIQGDQSHGIRRVRPAVRAEVRARRRPAWPSTRGSCATSRSASRPTARRQVRVVPASTTSSTSTATCRGPRCTCRPSPRQTERVHVGSAIFNITPKVNHPARVAENGCLARPHHQPPVRVRHRSRDRRRPRCSASTSRASTTPQPMWDETVREIPKMWKPRAYTYEGDWFRMPAREVFPKPNGPSHPAIWVAAGSPPTFAEGGDHGARRVLLHARHSRQDRSADPVLQGRRRQRRARRRLRQRQHHGASPTWCAWRTASKAFETAVEHGHELLHEPADALARQHPEARPNYPVWPDRIPEPTVEQLKKRPRSAMVAVGDPDDCAKAVQRWVDIGADQLCFSPTTNNLPPTS